MELYQIIATCSNYAGAGNPRTLSYIPENFKGVKITQKFNWQNPIGYTPTYSIETMKIIDEDKEWLDAIFDLYGLQSSVTFGIYKLNDTATAYVLKASFLVDFESYSKQDYYSEFALKSISCIDEYNKTKNTSINVSGTSRVLVPVANKYINYVSLKKTIGSYNGDHTAFIELEQNEESKVYNDDTALFLDYRHAYQFNRGANGTANIVLSAFGSITVAYNWTGGDAILRIKLYKCGVNETINFDYPVFQFGVKSITLPGSAIIEVDRDRKEINNLAFTDEDYLFIGVECNDESLEITGVYGDLSVEMYVDTELTANPYNRQVDYLTAETILNDIFDDNATIETALKSIGVTSSQTIVKRMNYVSLIPKDFVNDFCLATGSIVNFKNSGAVEIEKINTYFPALLNKANAVELTYFKNIVISYDESLNFISVSAGMEQRDYQVQTYFNEWMKILTFAQANREASENLNLALTKYRCDFNGIIDYINQTSKTATEKSNDYFFFAPALTPRVTSEGNIYDYFTPRDILESWSKFLEAIFYNYDKTTLSFVSGGGDDFNLQIAGVNQLDDFVFSGTDPKILPLKVEFSCLIEDTDFTEKILKITDGGVEMFIFVTEAQTTDSLEEQKIKGNLIYFSPE